ncbi:M12 family metallo-peptidase [Bacillus sp. CLL-7-23]|uniref:M12 family metallo-peptidase n=1 Tax=Bacillus changyiensis TaxID=3004103 RepID=A0ABT4WZ63_9BACI|nr:M12 family metallo-peptidase [Bacillus changyiensis]MDA7025338.1 M12 family metallo-peptidase [Bacillus changyiensis]
MKKRFFGLTMFLSASLISGATVGASSLSAHQHSHEKSGTQIESIPKANHFEDLTEKVEIEKTTKTKILNEQGDVIGAKTFKQNVNSGNIRIKEDAGKQRVSVLAVADEQYRKKHSDWQTRIVEIIEQADMMFNRDHDIDFVVESVAPWVSSGSSSSDILWYMADTFKNENYQFVIGFTANENYEAGGVAYKYNYKPNGPAFSTVFDMGTKNAAKATTHELTHNLGVGHDPQGSGIQCIMNYDYAYKVDVWDDDHNGEIERNKEWYQ